MWPDVGNSLAFEQAVADLYAEALRRWAPTVQAATLPTLTAATLPPDPQAVTQQQQVDEWSAVAETVIVSGIALLWSVAVVEAAAALGIALPDLPESREFEADDIVFRTVRAATGMSRIALADAFHAVDAAAAWREAREELLAAHRQRAAETPAVVAAKVEAAVRANPDDTDVQREAVSMALDTSGPDIRDIAHNAGYQAAAVQNHAVLVAAAARNEEFGEELHKVWIATLDGKTRPTHWAADGQRVPIGGAFTVGNEQLAFPGDPTASAAERMNCRCRVGVLAADEDIPDEVDRHTERLDGRDSVVINRDGRTQAEEIERRKREGNIRARDDEDGIGRVASGGWAAPSEQEHDMPKVSTVDEAVKQYERFAADNDVSDGDEETYLTFTDALFAVTGVPTSDGRMLATDIELTFRDTPMPLQWCEEMEGGHFGSVTVGVIESITYSKGEIRGSGFMLNSDNAAKAVDLVSHGVCNPSVDLGNVDWVATDEDGNVVTEENYEEGMAIYMTVTKAEVLATTIVAIPAFGQTRIALNEQRETRAKQLVASAAAQFKPRVYDPALFADPKLSGPTLLTITEDGHVFGHIACFGECHRSIQSECIMAPRSQTGYRHFHTSPAVHLSDGSMLPVGRLTVGTGHAPEGLAAGPAVEHYDNTGTCWAIGRVGEDAHGIYFSGVVAPWATPEQIEQGLSSPLSGDWRRLDGNLELVAALSVNTPGFLARGVTDDAGAPTTLVASLAPSPTIDRGGVEHLTIADIKAAVAEALSESQRAAELAARREAALARAHAAIGDPPPTSTPAERVAQLLAERA